MNPYVSPFDPANLPWRSADGMDGVGLSWSYAYTYADPQYQPIIPPVKSTERSHWVNCSGINRIIIIPDKTPLLFDKTRSYGTYPDFVFNESQCNHFDISTQKPYGVNAVYMDGHIKGRGADEIAILRNKGVYGQHWF